MLIIKRGEPFTVEVTLDVAADGLKRFDLVLVQHGRTILRKGIGEAEFSEDSSRAYFPLDGRETARLQTGDPAFAQAHALYDDGEVLHSEIEEINVIDVLGAGKERA